jgi:hypothetical protein
MELHYQLTDAQFEQQFQACTLDPAVFSHEAHLRLAWIHIQKYGEGRAIEMITQQLQRFVEHVGAKDKYNHTLTIAAIKAVNHFINKSMSDSFPGFMQEFPRLKTNFREIIGTHYQHDIFKSVLGKKQYVEPDLLPFT